MVSHSDLTKETPSAITYEIRVEGQLGGQWTEWFETADITPQANGETILVCRVIDQPTLYGLLKKVRDLGVPLVSVNRIDPVQAKFAPNPAGAGNEFKS